MIRAENLVSFSEWGKPVSRDVIISIARRSFQLRPHISVLLVLGMCGSCGGSNTGNFEVPVINPPPIVVSVTVSPDTWDADRIGQRAELTATALDAFGNPIPGVEFTWESIAPDVAQVDDDGIVTAFSAGLTTLRLQPQSPARLR